MGRSFFYGKIRSSLKTLLFDNDGVLVNTERLYFSANRQVLQRFDVELSLSQFADISLRQGNGVIRSLLPDCSETRIRELVADRNHVYSELLEQHRLEVPGAAELLERLKHNYRIGIVTSSRKYHFDTIHRRTALLQHVNFILTREDYLNSKPAPDPYLKALKQAKTSATICLVIEDTPRGHKAATAAGIHCLVIPNPMLTRADFPSETTFINKLDEIEQYLEEKPGPLMKQKALVR